MLNQPVLLYDGECAFCQGWVARLERADRENQIATVPSQQRQEWFRGKGAEASLPPLGDEELSRAMYLVLPDGKLRRGARALPEILRRLPRWAWLAPLLRIPGVLWIGDRVYQWIATRRHRFGCAGGACRLD